MPTLEVRVDGQVAFTGEVPEVVLPQRPELYPQVLRPQSGTAPTPLARIMMLTALLDLMRRALESPMLQPVQVEIMTHGVGQATIAVALDLPEGSR